jgi:DNA-binding GntR family transcriptional regulator
VLTLTQRFHAVIDEAAGNPMLVDMIATATAFDATARLGAATLLGRRYPAKQGHDDHQELQELMRAHTQRTPEQFLSLAEQAAQPPPG